MKSYSVFRMISYIYTQPPSLFCMYTFTEHLSSPPVFTSSLAKGYDPLLSILGRLSQNFVIPAYRPVVDLWSSAHLDYIIINQWERLYFHPWQIKSEYRVLTVLFSIRWSSGWLRPIKMRLTKYHATITMFCRSLFVLLYLFFWPLCSSLLLR
jgi:hypothetical protein